MKVLNSSLVLTAATLLISGTAFAQMSPRGQEHVRHNLNAAEQAADNQIRKDAVRKQFASLDLKFEAPVAVVLDCAERVNAADFQVLAKKLSHPSAGQALAEAVSTIRGSAAQGDQQTSGDHVVAAAALRVEEQETIKGYFRLMVLSTATNVGPILNCMDSTK